MFSEDLVDAPSSQKTEHAVHSLFSPAAPRPALLPSFLPGYHMQVPGTCTHVVLGCCTRDLRTHTQRPWNRPAWKAQHPVKGGSASLTAQPHVAELCPGASEGKITGRARQIRPPGWPRREFRALSPAPALSACGVFAQRSLHVRVPGHHLSPR